MKPPTLFDDQGRPVRLGAHLGRGGEGSVWEDRDHPEVVVKVYHQPLKPERAEKIAALVGLRTDDLLKVAAWPLDGVRSRSGGDLVGFRMPRVAGRDIHELYSPKSRLAEFPEATWAFLAHAAANLARGFAVVHDHGHVVGDVNHGNVRVTSQATVRFIDCDSFQVRYRERVLLCGVGVGTHQPPELQGKSLRVLRSADHDRFGLAVLIFQLLFMGRHPFSGTHLGPGDMPIERAIHEHRFAYGPGAPSRQMRQPPNTLDLLEVSPPVAALFERAFAPDAVRLGRPRAEEWIEALERLELETCRLNSAHRYVRGLPRCPWCRLEGTTGFLFFDVTIATIRVGTSGAFDLAVVWARITAVESPGSFTLAAASLPATSAVPSASTVRKGRIRRLCLVLAVALGGAGGGAFLTTGEVAFLVASLLVAFWLGQRGRGERAEMRGKVDAARRRLKALSKKWLQEAGDAAFKARLRELRELRAEYLDLPARRQRGLASLRAQLRERQLRRFLDQHRIDRAKIPGIGPGRIATLQSYGIETAADVVPRRVGTVPGFGPRLTERLMSWRRSIERRFVFDASKGVDPADVAALDREIELRRQQIEAELTAGPSQLQVLRQRALARRGSVPHEVVEAQRALAQAEADFRAA